MKILSGKEFVSLLKKHGWTVKGIHYVMTKHCVKAGIDINFVKGSNS
jgi:hypothetical protein